MDKCKEKFMSLFIHLFIQQILTKLKLCARHCSTPPSLCGEEDTVPALREDMFLWEGKTERRYCKRDKN